MHCPLLLHARLPSHIQAEKHVRCILNETFAFAYYARALGSLTLYTVASCSPTLLARGSEKPRREPVRRLQ